jgi:hypothetical protein
MLDRMRGTLHLHRTPLGAAGLIDGRQIWLALAVTVAALIALIWGFAVTSKPFFFPLY